MKIWVFPVIKAGFPCENLGTVGNKLSREYLFSLQGPGLQSTFFSWLIMHAFIAILLLCAQVFAAKTSKKWYFVTKIVLTYYEKKIVLVIEKNFWNSRLKAENLQTFWDH